MKNVNNIFKPIFLLMVVFCVIVSMSCVCAASDINNASTVSENAVDFEMSTVEVNDVHEDVVSAVELNDASDDANVVKESKNTLADKGEIKTPGTYDDFVNDFGNLTPGSVVEITKDYNLDTKSYSYITLDKENVTINGNGHMISGSTKDSRIFKVTADGVKINDLVFTNPGYEFANSELLIRFAGHEYVSNYAGSPIIVNGNHDEVNGCRFIGTKAVNGGSIFWNGNNGKIDNCTFSNVQSKYFGGALCMEGSHNTISNCVFSNCTSGLSQDTIYMENAQNNEIAQNNVMAKNSKIYDGKGSGLNVSLFRDSVPAKVADKDIELYGLLYSALGEGGVHYIDKDTWYYCDYYNETHDLVLNIFRNFTDSNVLFGKCYHFNNVSNPSDVFQLTSQFKYYLDYHVIKTVYVNDTNSYSAAIKTTDGCLDSFMGYVMDKADSATPSYIKTKLLNIVFADNITIDSAETIMASNLGFNMINIDGHNSNITTSSDNRDEHKWLVLTNDVIVMANNLTVSGFNTALENMAGNCIFDNVNFNGNHMKYISDRDWGAAMLNLGVVLCHNCSFSQNYAKNGGAIFNQGLLTLENCTFDSNTAYNVGKDVCVGDNGQVMVDGVNVTGNTALVYCAESMTVGETAVVGALCIGASFALGIVAGVVTANPAVGLVVGAVVGAGIGATGATYIIANHYDVNFDRVKTVAILVGACAIAGAAGGYLGGAMASVSSSTAAAESGANAGETAIDSGNTVLVDEVSMDAGYNNVEILDGSIDWGKLGSY